MPTPAAGTRRDGRWCSSPRPDGWSAPRRQASSRRSSRASTRRRRATASRPSRRGSSRACASAYVEEHASLLVRGVGAPGRTLRRTHTYDHDMRSLLVSLVTAAAIAPPVIHGRAHRSRARCVRTRRPTSSGARSTGCCGPIARSTSRWRRSSACWTRVPAHVVRRLERSSLRYRRQSCSVEASRLAGGSARGRFLNCASARTGHTWPTSR